MSNRNNKTDLYYQHEVARGANSSVNHVTSPLHSLSAAGSGVQVNTQSLLQAATASAQNVGRMLDYLDFQTKHVGQGREVNRSRFQLDPTSGRMRELPCCEETVWVEDPASELRANALTRPTTIERCELNNQFARSPHVVKQVKNVHPMQRPKTCSDFSAEADSFDVEKDEVDRHEYLRQLDEWKTNRRVLESDLLTWSEAAIARGKQNEDQQRIADARKLQAARRKKKKDRMLNKEVMETPYFGNETDMGTNEDNSSGSDYEDEGSELDEESKSQELLEYLRAVAAERARITSVGETIADLIPLLRKRHVSLDDLQIQLQELSTRLIGTASGDRNIIAYTERLEARMQEQDKMRESQKSEQSAIMTVTAQRDRFKALIGIKDEQIEQLKAAVDSLRLQPSPYTQGASGGGSMRGMGGAGRRASRFGGGDTPVGPWNGLSQWTFPHDPADRSNSPKIEAFALGSNSMNMGAYQGIAGGAKVDNSRNYNSIGATSPHNAAGVSGAATPLSRIGSSLLLGGGAIRKHASFKNKPVTAVTTSPTPPTSTSTAPQQSEVAGAVSGMKPAPTTGNRSGAPAARRATMPTDPENNNDSDLESCDEALPPNMGRRGTAAGSQPFHTSNTSRAASVNHEHIIPAHGITAIPESVEIGDLKHQIITLRAVVRLTCMYNQKLQERLKLAAVNTPSSQRKVQFELSSVPSALSRGKEDAEIKIVPDIPEIQTSLFSPMNKCPTCTTYDQSRSAQPTQPTESLEHTPNKHPVSRCRGTQTTESRIELEKLLIAMSQRKGTVDAPTPLVFTTPVNIHDKGGPRFQAGGTIWPQNRKGVTNEERAIWSATSLYEAVMNTTSEWVLNQQNHVSHNYHQEEPLDEAMETDKVDSSHVSPRKTKPSSSQLKQVPPSLQQQGTLNTQEMYVGLPKEKLSTHRKKRTTMSPRLKQSFGDTCSFDLNSTPQIFTRPKKPRDPKRNLEAEATTQTQSHRPSKLLGKKPRPPIPIADAPPAAQSKEDPQPLGANWGPIRPMAINTDTAATHTRTKVTIPATCSRQQPFVADPPPL